jgi:hypothetical protein
LCYSWRRRLARLACVCRRKSQPRRLCYELFKYFQYIIAPLRRIVTIMADLTNPRLIYFKGFLFLFGGLLSAALLIQEAPTLKTVLLVGVTVWCFSRFYYFAFYVIEHYVDPGYRFAGLWSFALYVLRRRSKR